MSPSFWTFEKKDNGTTKNIIESAVRDLESDDEEETKFCHGLVMDQEIIRR